ncbi:uncharacterized protein N0V89_009506 [Didymosphaeria variabile]|uniref:Transcription initiation factor TFIID subunit 1 histone acetyltransferase domain-containing protein n=1 Tax=Didymosphaeria variabile TaxID=1932322 RepID=A0A9W9C881_9PLEO|nr:uncharacterized protein N0V89_009506 [Didymosphaeria variabile]KAJ4348134.1 hypothetical protein N0V89_009506 [Didymosphaeria variabile]
MDLEDLAAEAAGDPTADDVDADMKQVFADANTNPEFWANLATMEIGGGEKAEDAMDYGDISDDDLASDHDDDGDENEQGNSHQLSGTTVQDEEDLQADEDIDALFNEDAASPVPEHSQDIEAQKPGSAASVPIVSTGGAGQTVNATSNVAGDDEDPEWVEQRRLFAEASRPKGERIPLAPTSDKELFRQLYPDFEKGKPLRFSSLIPRKRAYFKPQEPAKAPKPLAFGTKINLDIATDQEKSFRLPSTTVPVKHSRVDEEEEGGIIHIQQRVEKEGESSDEMDLDVWEATNDHEVIGNVTWGDLEVACEDWNIDSDSIVTLSDSEGAKTPELVSINSAPKRRRLGDRDSPVTFSVYDHMSLPSWDDPEFVTAKLAKKIILDMNDPQLLLDVQQPTVEEQKPRTIGVGLKRDPRGGIANPMLKRFNISNDEHYDALKESSQQKVRGTIGNSTIDHSLPALKLQYPFYKVHLSDRELRSFHRPTVAFKPGERAIISALKSVKRKNKRHLKPSEAFAVAEDLNIGDNADLLLAEYSEEYPTTLSNFGMGVKVFNYYRRRTAEDNNRPKPAIGETQILLPHDKSPFAMFGPIEPGEEWLTLQNAMYRAPIFQHNPEKTDFLVSRSQTGVHGSKYYMRNIDNLVVVGQEFPYTEVPGTHARKVTEASKKRLKMLAFRLYRRGQQNSHRQPWVSNEMIKHHLPGTEIAQNRSRMREIMKYDKNVGTWQPVDGETIPDEPTLRTWIKPEDICLIDSMHAGDKQLQDAGIKTDDIKDDEDGDGNETLELKLAPWHTTKNFLNACTGKAMLTLHGEGDPTGRNEGFSFIKTSMKGGFKDIGESTADKIDARNKKDNGGHSYNVQKQQQQYEDAIKRIWNKQKDSLRSAAIPSDEDLDVDAMSQPNPARGRSEAPTPYSGLRGEDETMSQFSRNSAGAERGKKLRIVRKFRNRHDEIEEKVQIITDPEVIKLYMKRKKQQRLLSMNIDDIKPTGNAEFDHQQMLKLKAEMARLQRNIERREGREKAKGIAPSNGKSSSTPRKCANCGEVGHIKTNKKCAKTVSFVSPL